MERVLIADKDPGVRQVLEKAVSKEGYQVVGRAGNGADVLRLVVKKSPSLLLLDVDIDAPEGLTLLRHLSRDYPWLRVLVLSDLDADIYSVRCMKLGAKGYLNRNMSFELLPLMLKSLQDGRLLFPAVSKKHKELSFLSDRELVALRCLARGVDERGIAATLTLTSDGVQAMQRRLRGKLRLNCEKLLCEYGKRLGLD